MTQPDEVSAGFAVTLDKWTWLLALLTVVLMALPFLRYIVVGWRLKLDTILDNFDPQSIRLYFRKYRTSERTAEANSRPLRSLDKAADEPLLVAEFLRLYRREFGRGVYLIPFIILMIATFIAALAVVQTGLFHARLADLFAQFGAGAKSISAVPPSDQFDAARRALYGELVSPSLLLDATTIAALAGAYMWVVQDAITRMRSGDMLPSDIYWAALRMTIAAPLGVAIASVANEAAGPFVAFGIGAFPIEQIQRFLRTLTTKALGVTDDPDTDGDDVKKLIGVNNDVAHRLIVENASTVLELAKCDPVWLTMRTNLDPEVVAELIDQAIVWMSFASAKADDTAAKMERLRASSLASATRVAELVSRLNPAVQPGLSAEEQAKIAASASDAAALLRATAASLPFDDGGAQPFYSEMQLRRIFDCIAEDDVTRFLVRLKALGTH